MKDREHSNQGSGLPSSRQLVEIPGLEVLTGTFRNHAFPRHTHDGLMIALIDGGAQRLEHAGERFVALPGQIVSMPGRYRADHGHSPLGR